MHTLSEFILITGSIYKMCKVWDSQFGILLNSSLKACIQ